MTGSRPQRIGPQIASYRITEVKTRVTDDAGVTLDLAKMGRFVLVVDYLDEKGNVVITESFDLPISLGIEGALAEIEAFAERYNGTISVEQYFAPLIGAARQLSRRQASS